LEKCLRSIILNRNVQVGYINIRRDVTANDTALAAATYDSLPANRVSVSADATSLILMAFGTGDAGGTALVNIFGGRGQKGKQQQPAILLSSITFTRGTMQCNNDPADPALAALASNYYFGTVVETAAGGVADLRIGNDSGNDRIGLAIIRLTGESWIYAEVKTLTNITKFNLVGSWVNEALPES